MDTTWIPVKEYIEKSMNIKKDNDKDIELISAETSNEIDGDTYNQWSLEFDLGQSRGGRPYSPSTSGWKELEVLGGRAHSTRPRTRYDCRAFGPAP